MQHPDTPAAVSISEAGEMADDPIDVMGMAVSDENDDTEGYLVRWRSDEWIYADIETFEYLETLNT